MISVVLSFLLLHLPAFTAAYSWTFQAAPQQCSNLTIQITGNDGKPPYRLLIVPYGPSPFSNNTEVRKIIDQEFSGDSTSITVPLNYPANSQLVAVVSDSSGFGTGGTSAAAQVTSSNDQTCYDPTQNVQPAWGLDLSPSNQIVQCVSTRIFWQPSNNISGTPIFLGIIPGGQSFIIPEGSITDESSQGLGTGFSWTPSIRGGTQLLIVGGDNKGNGTGGSVPETVSNGESNNSTCLNSSSPSSTPGTPAGGSYPTSSDGSGVNGGGSGGGGNNTGAIVGGVVGGIALIVALILVLLFFRRRAKLHREQKEKPDLLVGDVGDDSHAARTGQQMRNDMPEYYQPEPFTVPDTSAASTSDPSERRMSESTLGTYDVLSTSGASSSAPTGKRAQAFGRLRPVNIIQHDDAGPGEEAKHEEPETIELPPAYTNIRK